MFAGRCELQQHYYQQHHYEIGDDGEDAEAQGYCDDLWFEDDFAFDEFQAIGASHGDGAT